MQTLSTILFIAQLVLFVIILSNMARLVINYLISKFK